MKTYYTLKWQDRTLSMIDQRLLPGRVEYTNYTQVEDVADGITRMVVRGAPAIGAAAGYGMALAAFHALDKDPNNIKQELQKAATILINARPTAVNLTWAVNRILARVQNAENNIAEEIARQVEEEAIAIENEDRDANRLMGEHGASLVPQNARFIHHCNTGALATTGIGTALGVIRTAQEWGRNVFVYVDETRPRLQGARLTTWELQQLGIPHQIIVDGAAAHIMRTRGVDLCVVGCDRVAANGDTANKIGTFQLALAAYEMGVPFYVVGPTSTIDMNLPDGDHIPVEERAEEEITHIEGLPIAPVNTRAFNPAFDVTPAKYITAIITEKGISRPPYNESLSAIFP